MDVTSLSTPLAEVRICCDFERTVSAENACQIVRISRLLQRYSRESPNASSGGLQQFVNRLQLNSAPVRDQVVDRECPFSALPDEILVKIFVDLPAEDLLHVFQVSRRWWNVAQDHVLWKKKLDREMHSWDYLGHDSNPLLFADCESDLSSKEIYLRCCPRFADRYPRQALTAPSLRSFFRSLFPRKTPRLAMLGPGLETKTSVIVRRMMDRENGLFSILRMFPGQSGGIGSGFTYKFSADKRDYHFDLTTIYSSTRAERGVEGGQDQRLNFNKLFAPHADTSNLELTQQAKELCLSLDGLIYVVDANQSEQGLAQAYLELYAITQLLWSKPEVPLVVLSLTREDNVPRKHSCVDLIRWLQLNQLRCAWRVANGAAESLVGVPRALVWLIEQCYSA